MTSLAQAEAMLGSIASGYEAGTLLEWGVALREGGSVVGTVTLASIDRNNRRAEIGFMLARDVWRQGYMTEALSAALDYAFGPLDLGRIEADVDPSNAASLRVLQRLGFAREGYLRERWRVGGGVQDTALLGLLRREWLGDRRAGRPPSRTHKPSTRTPLGGVGRGNGHVGPCGGHRGGSSVGRG